MNAKKPQKQGKAGGIVYSTNPGFRYDDDDVQETATLPPQQQNLRIMLDKKLKGGKKATLVTGFIGTSSDLSDLARQLKNMCAAGGNTVDGNILIQGDFRQKIMDFFLKKGYKVKLAGG